jgi:hypothetical protein
MKTNHSINLSGLNGSTQYHFRVGSKDASNNGPTVSNEINFTTDPTPDLVSPSMVPFPVIDYANDTIDVTFSESNMQNTSTEANYTFSPSLLFGNLGGSDDIASLGNNKYRLSMTSIPKNLIYTLTVSNITDAASNPVVPNSIKINDDDNDSMPDDWEAASGVGSPSEDSDSDGLSNLEEYNNSTNPNQPDTDNDGLPDGWETTYGLDPNDDTGLNGRDGDPDGDTWTNYEEYLNGHDPNNNRSPKAKAPRIKKTIPRGNSKGKNKNRVPIDTPSARRVPIDTSFAIRVLAPDGIDVKLTADEDTKVKNAWVVYDRSLDPLGNFDYDADVNIKVEMTDKRGTVMPQESYDFNIETTAEHDLAQVTRPDTTNSNDAGITTLTVANGGEMDGFQLIYNNTEPIIPLVEPFDEIPSLDLPNVTPVDRPVKLGPPNVFNNPVTLRVPVSGETDIKDMSVYLYDGEEWVYAVSSHNTGGVIQPGGEDWVVPGSLTYDDTGATPVLEVQVYHFSGIQAGYFFGGLPFIGIDDVEASTGGCFIDTINLGTTALPFEKSTVIVYLLFSLALIFIAWGKRRG